ncbi:hypothetical protein SOMG_02358 [Schizosaccharomyces osmophilus]|uniref:Uncharacterized protein n=1 Tax=Schizosaccharomyces osmophilus TaxID=2545709 RepID=A0AAE9W946_9SCHI|nr:uncharacterized protein SOMG_02358 [Schizosaccharomyces osmophilus]WBW71469.1 hypothetical protein SOMG_02358 [Schizosaccharomyces osmophilus]
MEDYEIGPRMVERNYWKIFCYFPLAEIPIGCLKHDWGIKPKTAMQLVHPSLLVLFLLSH